MKRHEADDFLRGYLDAALFTTDPSPPGGCDYVESGRADELFPSIPADFIEQAKKDCAKFTAERVLLLSQAGDPWQNGADFWYTRNGHGVGFWDRGYHNNIADPLTDAAHAYGDHYLFAEDLGLGEKA